MKFFYLLLTLLFSSNSFAGGTTLVDINKLTQEMENKYAIKFKVDSMPKTSWEIKYKFAQKQDYANLAGYLHLIDAAFSQYPLVFLKKSKIKEIVFVKGLKYNIDNNEQATPVVTDFPKNVLIFDFIIGNYNKAYQKHSIHLAFYQMLDKKLNRDLDEPDSTWNGFNVSDNVYGSQGIYANNKPIYGINHNIEGFISSYSLTGISQDKAEIFVALYTPEEAKKIKPWMKDDKILLKKVDYMKKFLKNLEQSSIEQKITLREITKYLSSMEEKYHIKFSIDFMPATTWKLDYDFVQSEDYDNLYYYLKLFDKEFNKYPLSFIKKSNLVCVVFVKGLALDMGNNVKQQRGAIPEYVNELLILDFLAGNHDKDFQRHGIHHEFYHMIEEQINGDTRWKDPKWNGFNQDNDAYGMGGEFYRGSEQSTINHPFNGFISLYSLSALEEDKAEIFAALFTKNDYTKLRKWIKEDKILANKVNYMKNFLKEIDPSFTNKYWHKIQE